MVATAVWRERLTATSRQPVTLKARTVLPMHGPPLHGGWVRIAGGRVLAVGRRQPVGPVIDCGDALLLPGLVNPHTHLEFSTISTPVPPHPPGGLAGWIPAVVAARRAAVHEETAAAIHAGLQQSAAAGVTLVGEIATASPHLSYPTAGVPRLRIFRECLGLSHHRSQVALGQVRQGLARLPPAMAGLSPHAPYSVAAPLAKALLQMATAQRLPVAVHLAESREEGLLVAHGKGPFRELLEGLGAWPTPPPRLLTAAEWVTLACRSPRAAFIHATFIDDATLARLARHRDRAAVVVCPRTAALISGSLAPVRRLLNAGIQVAVGTDGRGSAPDLAPLAEARCLVDQRLVSPLEALRMVTTTAAWALGCEHVAGRLLPGRAADLTILQPAEATADPFADALAASTRVLATLRSGRLIHGQT